MGRKCDGDGEGKKANNRTEKGHLDDDNKCSDKGVQKEDGRQGTLQKLSEWDEEDKEQDGKTGEAGSIGKKRRKRML